MSLDFSKVVQAPATIFDVSAPPYPSVDISNISGLAANYNAVDYAFDSVSSYPYIVNAAASDFPSVRVFDDVDRGIASDQLIAFAVGLPLVPVGAMECFSIEICGWADLTVGSGGPTLIVNPFFGFTSNEIVYRGSWAARTVPTGKHIMPLSYISRGAGGDCQFGCERLLYVRGHSFPKSFVVGFEIGNTGAAGNLRLGANISVRRWNTNLQIFDPRGN